MDQVTAENVPKFNTLIEAIAHWAEHTPDRVCLIDANNDRKMTYAEFWYTMRVFARRLLDAGVRPGDRVVVRVGPLLETFVAQFGIYLASGVYCPVEKHMKPLKTIEMMEYFDAKLLISTESIGSDYSFIELSDLGSANADRPLESPELPDPESLAAIVFTTGTTGKAKGVMLNHKSFAIFAYQRADVYDHAKESAFIWVSPLDRVSGVRVFGEMFVVGGTAIHYGGIVFLEGFFQAIEKYKVTAIHLQSFALNIILNAGEKHLRQKANQLQVVTTGDSFVSNNMRVRLRNTLPQTRLFIQYGLTEVSPISIYEFSKNGKNDNCVGKPLPRTKVHFHDDNGLVMNETSNNKIGNLLVDKDVMMMGYYNDAELTKKYLKHGFLITTDMGYMDGEGFLYLVGRKDDVIVSGGHKIAPYEIESIAMQMPGITEAVCVPGPDKIMGHVPRLFVTMKAEVEFSAKEIMAYLSERLETYKLPRTIRLLDAFPRINDSKINRKELKNYE